MNYLTILTQSVKKARTKIALVAFCSFAFACKENFIPPIVDERSGTLVVEGFINTGNDSTIIKLSKTTNLTTNVTTPAEKGATVRVENDAGQTFPLTEIRNGIYVVAKLNADISKKYRLSIKTSNGRQYFSDFVEAKSSAPVDLTFDFNNDMLNVYANSIDVEGKSNFYLLTYKDTYEYHAFHVDVPIKVLNHKLTVRDLQKDPSYICWRSSTSTNVNLSSTKSLNQDKIQRKVISIPSTSERLAVEYSILVKQTILTKEGYNFWTALSKNTEEVGGIFDNQPSLLKGNIHSVTDPAEVVVGFISAGTTSEKRINILHSQLPGSFKPFKLSSNECKIDTVKEGEMESYILNPPVPLHYPLVGGLIAQHAPCADCTTAGGTNVKPSFWK